MAAVAVLALGCLLTACGSSGTKSAEGPSSSSQPAAKIGLLWEIKGDSPNAISDYDNGARIALDEINAAGGVLGKPVESFREPMSISDPQKARASFLKAEDQHPSVLVGPIFAIQPYARDIDEAGIPIIQVSAEANLGVGDSGGSKWMFAIEPYGGAAAKYAVDFAQQKLNATSVGIIATDEASGHNNANQSKKEAESLKLKIGAENFVSVKTTDVTSAVLALKGESAILAWEFPNVLGLTMKQLKQNNIKVPVIGTATTQIAVAGKLIPADVLSQLYGMVPCGLSTTSARSQSKAFTETYLKRFGSLPSSKAAESHDAVWLMAEAMKKAGTTTDHAKILQALESLTWTGGACQPSYHADGAHYLSHQIAAVQYQPDGSAKDVASYTIPALSPGQKLD